MIGAEFADVLRAAQHGDESAFGVLWLDANPPLVRYLGVLAGDAGADLAADTWLSVVRSLHRFRGDEAAWRSWLFTIARHRAVDETRRRLRRPPITAIPDEGWEPTVRDSAEDAMQYLDTRAALALVARLPRLQAEVVLLRVVAGLGVEDVARLVGRSPGAVRVAAHRGLRSLARLLADEGVTP